MEQGWPGLAQYVPAVPADWTPRPRTVQDALDQLAARAGGAGAAASFVWAPGGVAAPGVYTTFATLAAAVDTLDPRAAKDIAVDDSGGAAHIVAAGMPVGGWQGFENVRWLSAGADAGPGSALATIIVDQGAALAGIEHMRSLDVNWTYAATSGAFITTTGGANLSLIFEGCSVSGSGAGGAGLVSLGAGSALSLQSHTSALTGQLFAGSATSSAVCFFFNGSGLGPNVFNMTAGATLLCFGDGSSQANGVSAVQAPVPTVEILDPLTTFVFQPGGAGGANVFPTWPALMAAAGQSKGPKWIEIDTSLGAATVPAGTWNVDQCTFLGSTGRTQTVLGFATGAIFTWTQIMLDQSVRFINNGTGNVTTQAVAGWILFLHASNIQSAAAPAVPWLRASAGGTIQTFDAGSVGDNTHNVVTVDAGVTVVSQNLGSGATLAHAYGGLGAVSPQLDDAGGFSATQDITTVNATFFYSLAAQLAYTPGTAGNWNPVPSLANAALDQLAVSNTVASVGNTGTGTGTVTVTTANITKAKNGKMQVSASCLLSTSAAASTLTLQLKRDAANIGTAKTLVVPATGIPTGIDCTIDAIDTAPDNAAHTYTLSVSVSAGTLTVAASSAQIQVVEDS